MLTATAALLAGLLLLVWSADRFISGASATASHFRMPPLMIGMVVVGFGTSAPEMVVSALASLQGNPGLALGNAYGSNITNIALILGVTALLAPIAVHSAVLRKELPFLAAITALAAWQLLDGALTRFDALVLLGVFILYMAWTIREGLRNKSDALATEMAGELGGQVAQIKLALFWLVAGLVLLILASRLLVWGAVGLARGFGVSDLIIGLTIVALGTSLPELVSSIVAARKGEHDLALGNIIGSNLFNTLAVVGIAGVIAPMEVGPELLTRDIAVMAALTLSLFVFGYGLRGPGRINRIEGLLLLSAYIAYTLYLIRGVLAG